MVDVWIPYGRTEVCVRIPTSRYLGEIRPKRAEKPSNVDEEVARGLKAPIASDSLKKLSEGKKSASIAVDPSIKPELCERILFHLISELVDCGVEKSNISVIVGSSSRPLRKGFLQSFREDLRKIISIHDCRDESHEYVGRTKHGTELYVNKSFLNSDLRVVLSKVALHPFEGFSGGRELILPGISGIKSIKMNRALLLKSGSQPGVLEGNPVHEDMMEAAEMVGVDYCINLFLDDKGDLIKVFSGSLKSSFEKTVDLVRDHTIVTINERADIVVVGMGGYPTDSKLSDLIFALLYASGAVKRKGTIIAVAECTEGYGDETFYRWMVKFDDLKDVSKAIKADFEYGGEKAYYLLKLKGSLTLKLVSAIPRFYSENVFRLKTYRATNEALKETLREAGRGAKISVIPQGLSTLPVFKGG
ncbi:nickel-dependent lactate racemase [Candidatus Bathyarchaeota archaeon]|nr:nickel-dependent lactate racemase [Candidatus Bathyarchaeota archaeon]